MEKSLTKGLRGRHTKAQLEALWQEVLEYLEGMRGPYHHLTRFCLGGVFFVVKIPHAASLFSVHIS